MSKYCFIKIEVKTQPFLTWFSSLHTLLHVCLGSLCDFNLCKQKSNSSLKYFYKLPAAILLTHCAQIDDMSPNNEG